MTAAALPAEYTDLRFIKSRKVAQVILEIPIEAATAFVEAFGTPMPDRSVPVAIARLVEKEKRSAELKQQLTDSVEIEKRKGGALARRAGILCNEPRFWKFMDIDSTGISPASQRAAAKVREHCGIATRADLDHNQYAALKFINLDREYVAWLQV